MAQAPAGGLKVRIGRVTVDAANVKAVTEAIAAVNAHAHMNGVPDALNPWVIDPARALALLGAIAALPPAARAGLGHHAISLDTPGLPVKTSSPSTPASFVHLTGLQTTAVHGDFAEVHLTMPLDCGLAQGNAALAETSVTSASADIARLEKARRSAASDTLTKALDDLGAARRGRFVMAIAWHENAVADAACRPNDPQAKASLAAAARAHKDYVVSTGGIE